MRGGRGLSNIFFLHVEIMENISFFLALTLAMINIDKERASVLETEEPEQLCGPSVHETATLCGEPSWSTKFRDEVR